MKQKIPFVHKLLSRLDKVDRDSVSSYVRGLADRKTVYEEILNQLEDAVLVIDGDGALQYANRQALVWLEIPSKGWEGQFVEDYIVDFDLKNFILKDIQTLNDKKTAELPVLLGQELSLRVSVMPLENSEPSAYLITLRDNTRARQNILGAEKFARIESLLKLTSGIAHEIGNPLNSIGIHLQVLRKQLKDVSSSKKEMFEKGLDVISAETARLDHIVKNFLKAARKPPLRFKLEDLNRIAEEALQFMGEELRKNDIQYRFDGDEALPPFLMDRDRLYQVCINLIINAMEAMPRGGSLRVAISHKDKIAMLTFKDEGIGIPDEDLPHIFEPYFTTKKEGSGLGLMTVLNAVTDHGGKIEVFSKPKKGSTFVILLPVRAPKLQLPQYKTRQE
jgi:signal transduction histidine kinase